MHYISNETIIKLDLQKIAHHILFVGILSFFIHLMLHNYNISKENSWENDYRSRHSINDISNIIEPQIYNLGTKKESLSHIEQFKNKLNISERSPQNSTLVTRQTQENIKRIGNMTVIAATKATTLTDILRSINLSNTKSEEIKRIINKKYDLSHIRNGDVIHIVDLSKNNSVNFKITLVNKAEIFVKEKLGKYSMNVNDLTKKKPLVPTLLMKKQTISISNDGIRKSAVTQDMKMDLSNIIRLLKQENFFPKALEILYEKKSTKDEKLIFVDALGYNSKIRVYKYLDKTGTINYVKSNGLLLTRQNKKSQQKVSNFTLAYPIHNPIIESGFGMRKHPVIGKVKMHKGVDFRASRGTPIYAPADGIIIGMSNGRGFGKHVVMRHNSTYTTLYAHMHNFAYGKKAGMRVKKGEVIGYVGRTGLTTGDHLHFELHENSRPVNPLRMIGILNSHNDRDHINQLSKKQILHFNLYKADVERKLKLL